MMGKLHGNHVTHVIIDDPYRPVTDAELQSMLRCYDELFKMGAPDRELMGCKVPYDWFERKSISLPDAEFETMKEDYP